MITVKNGSVNEEMVYNYIDGLVNRFYKILPIKESGETTLEQYMRSLLREMLGFQNLIESFNNDDRYLTLLSILQYLIDHDDASVASVRSDVFRAINILKKLRNKYCADSTHNENHKSH